MSKIPSSQLVQVNPDCIPVLGRSYSTLAPSPCQPSSIELIDEGGFSLPANTSVGILYRINSGPIQQLYITFDFVMTNALTAFWMALFGEHHPPSNVRNYLNLNSIDDFHLVISGFTTEEGNVAGPPMDLTFLPLSSGSGSYDFSVDLYPLLIGERPAEVHSCSMLIPE